MHNTIPSATIETESLLLKSLGPEEMTLVYTTLPDEDIKRFMGYNSDEELYLERARSEAGLSMHNRTFRNFLLIRKKDAVVIGKCGYHTWMPMHSRAEIGYAMGSEEVKGSGYMTEAIGPIIAYGFVQMGLNRIEALIGRHNEPSQRLVNRLGFVEEGVMREHYCKNGIIEDSVCFSLLKREWDQRVKYYPYYHRL